MDPIKRWEKLKERIKKTAQKLSRKKASEDKVVIGQLAEIANELESNLPLTEEDDRLLENTKADLEDKLIERAKGIMFRSKVKWYEEGEKNTKYFYALEKAKYNSKTCYKVLSGNREIEDPQMILEEQRKFYKELYKEDTEVNFTLENKYNIKVPEGIKKDQDIQISLQNIQEAIRLMKNNKTPGQDGLPVDFYKVFWNDLKEVFYEMIIQVYQEELLHESARKGILNLIPKPNKDSRYIKNLRPITLLNTDYKIIEKSCG